MPSTYAPGRRDTTPELDAELILARFTAQVDPSVVRLRAAAQAKGHLAPLLTCVAAAVWGYDLMLLLR